MSAQRVCCQTYRHNCTSCTQNYLKLSYQAQQTEDDYGTCANSLPPVCVKNVGLELLQSRESSLARSRRPSIDPCRLTIVVNHDCTSRHGARKQRPVWSLIMDFEYDFNHHILLKRSLAVVSSIGAATDLVRHLFSLKRRCFVLSEVQV